jgi:hypothetical protein
MSAAELDLFAKIDQGARHGSPDEALVVFEMLHQVGGLRHLPNRTSFRSSPTRFRR